MHVCTTHTTLHHSADYLLMLIIFILLRTFSLSLSILLTACAGQPDVCRYLVTSNKAVPLIDLALTLLNSSLIHPQSSQDHPQLPAVTNKVVSSMGCSGTSLCGPILRLLASMVSTLATSLTLDEDEEEKAVIRQLVIDTIR